MTGTDRNRTETGFEPELYTPQFNGTAHDNCYFSPP